MGRRGPFTESEKAMVIELLKEGKGYISISRELGVSKGMVEGYIKRNRIDAKRPKKLSCIGCGAEFETSHGAQTYCTTECCDKHRRGTEFCSWCGKHFIKIVDHSKYCSRKCFHASTMNSEEEVLRRISELFGDGLKLISAYEGMLKDITVHCNKCGKDTTKIADTVLRNGFGCNWCFTKSHGEREIEITLDKMGVKYKREYTFPDLKSKRKLKYDFAILDESERVTGLIEFDGEQHFKAVDFFGGEAGLKSIKARDKKKSDYAKENGLVLLRIPYTSSGDIAKIIVEFLNYRQRQHKANGR